VLYLLIDTVLLSLLMKCLDVLLSAGRGRGSYSVYNAGQIIANIFDVIVHNCTRRTRMRCQVF
jgi:hypothetical protein